MNSQEFLDLLKNFFKEVSNLAFEEVKYDIVECPKAFAALTKRNEYEKNNPEPKYNSSTHNNYLDWRREVSDVYHQNKQEVLGEDLYYYTIAKNEVLEQSGVGKMEKIDSYGGEGKGEEWWIVWYFPKHDIYVKVNGYYQSYNGTDFGDWEDAVSIVKPQQKTITVYE